MPFVVFVDKHLFLPSRACWRQHNPLALLGHLDQPLSQKTSRYCWRIYFNVLEVLFLASVSPAFLPSKKACGVHKFGTSEFANSIPPFFATACHQNFSLDPMVQSE